ncbi:hypothetical protein CW304_16945 [Bacillus sp. UFRGS-B20]|nr:hypothetical protein CW304_16945 [Bacillus sp. UFRGS-B20]
MRNQPHSAEPLLLEKRTFYMEASGGLLGAPLPCFFMVGVFIIFFLRNYFVFLLIFFVFML